MTCFDNEDNESSKTALKFACNIRDCICQRSKNALDPGDFSQIMDIRNEIKKYFTKFNDLTEEQAKVWIETKKVQIKSLLEKMQTLITQEDDESSWKLENAYTELLETKKDLRKFEGEQKKKKDGIIHHKLEE